MDTKMSTILSDLRSRLQALYGPGLDRLVLFGSRARGDADPESDIDVLVVVSSDREIEEKREQADDIVYELCLTHDVVISCVFATPETADLSGMPFYRNVRREGVRV